MKKYIFTVRDLQDCLNDNKNIVIYGAGAWSQILIDYIIFAGRQDRVKGIVVSDKKGNISEYRGIKVYEAPEILRQGNYFILIAVSNRYLEDVRELVERHHGFWGQYSCITWNLINSMQDRRKRVAWNGEIDFLVAGFPKCGTTSLYNALRQFSDIYLSDRKENMFFEWCDSVENPFRVLEEVYFNDVREGQIVGMVETGYFAYVQQVYSTFGGDVRIIFLLRNPVNAVFSNFMMICRNGSDEDFFEKAFKKYNGIFSVGMFDEYIKYRMALKYDTFNYVYWIKDFMECYPKEQIKIVFLEELLRNPKTGMNDILKFIGSTNKYDVDELPHRNEGAYVMADIESYRFARQKANLNQELRKVKNYGKQFDEMYETRMSLRMKENCVKKLYNIKILPEQRRNTEKYYYDSVRDLEKLLDKDLSKLWF